MPRDRTGEKGRLNPTAIRRLTQYCEWLREERPFTAAWAASQLEVSERTVLRDLEFAVTIGWDVEYSRRKKGWVWNGGDLALAPIVLKEGEWIAPLVAEQALRAYRGTPYAGVLRSAFDKIIALLDAPVTVEPGGAPLPRFTGPPTRALEAEQFQRLTNACAHRRRLEITYYVPDRDEVTHRAIDPYHVFAYTGDWYVAAFDHLRHEWRTFALGERLRSLRETGETFAPDAAFDLDRYLAEGFGIFRGGPIEDITLRFAPAVARHMRERVWSESETKEELPEGGLLLRMRAPVNVGLMRFVLQYGAEVEVLAPESLRDQHLAELEGAVAQYIRYIRSE